MGEYFKPMRRKLGIVTLVMACLFAAGWVRSLRGTQDSLTIRTSDKDAHIFASFRDGFAWHRMNTPSEEMPPITGLFERFSFYTATFDHTESVIEIGEHRMTFDWLGFRARQTEFGEIKITAWAVPFWSVILPLTLLSAYLLLSKPHKSTSEKITEPIPVDGA